MSFSKLYFLLMYVTLATSTEKKERLCDRLKRMASKAWSLCRKHPIHLPQRPQNSHSTHRTVRNLRCFVSVHSVLSLCPERDFLSISKGTVVCRSHIVNISSDGVYTMSDGRTFQGRKRGMSSHRRLSAEIGLTNTTHRSLSMLEKCSLLDNMPLAFCVIELVFNEQGHGVDFIFRYCNAEMATVEGVPWRKC